MSNEGWRGTEALNDTDPATRFWEQVTDRAKPEEFIEGAVVTLEITHDGEILTRKKVRITEVVEDAKGRHCQFADIKPGEEYRDSDLVLVVPV